MVDTQGPEGLTDLAGALGGGDGTHGVRHAYVVGAGADDARVRRTLLLASRGHGHRPERRGDAVARRCGGGHGG